MRIWLQNFVSIQPRTSLEKSDVGRVTRGRVTRGRVSRGRRRGRQRRGNLGGPRAAALRDRARRRHGGPHQIPPAAHCSTRLATTHHSFLGSFSAVSKRNFATKYAFFQVFRDLQNYLADFLKKLQNFAKNRKKLQNFCEISGFLQKKC